MPSVAAAPAKSRSPSNQRRVRTRSRASERRTNNADLVYSFVGSTNVSVDSSRSDSLTRYSSYGSVNRLLKNDRDDKKKKKRKNI
ncbi:hypothetical protein Trydic_g13520 [Trypoxylus dichotomus]